MKAVWEFMGCQADFSEDALTATASNQQTMGIRRSVFRDCQLGTESEF